MTKHLAREILREFYLPGERVRPNIKLEDTACKVLGAENSQKYIRRIMGGEIYRSGKLVNNKEVLR